MTSKITTIAELKKAIENEWNMFGETYEQNPQREAQRKLVIYFHERITKLISSFEASVREQIKEQHHQFHHTAAFELHRLLGDEKEGGE